jgi:hypothetical protein
MSTEDLPQSIDPTVTAPMADQEPQTAGGKVHWHFTMSLDGFVAGPNHTMDWMTGTSFRPGLVAAYVETTGAVLGGRDGFDAYPDVSGIYGGAWQGPVFVLTHHPEDTQPAEGGDLPELRCGRGGPDWAGGCRRQEPRDLLAHDWSDSSSSTD